MTGAHKYKKQYPNNNNKLVVEEEEEKEQEENEQEPPPTFSRNERQQQQQEEEQENQQKHPNDDDIHDTLEDANDNISDKLVHEEDTTATTNNNNPFTTKTGITARTTDINTYTSTATANNVTRTTTQRNLTFVFIFITISLSSGLVYGWPALRRNLLLYENSPLTERQLGLIFTVGGWSTLGSRLFIGILRDGPLGTRHATLLSLLAVSGGCAGMAFASQDHVTALAISYFLVGFGSGTQLCLQPVAASWFEEEMQGVVLATTSGAFQVSGLVFWVLVDFVSRDRRVSLGGFVVVLCFVALVCWRVLPSKPQGRSFDSSSSGAAAGGDGGEEQKGDDEGEDPRDDANENNHINDEEDNSSNHHDEHALVLVPQAQQQPNDSLRNLMKTWEYILLLLWFSLQLIPLQYYVATIGFQLERKGDDRGTYVSLFPIMYASAAIFAPVFGKIADRFGLGIAQGLANALSILSLVILSAPVAMVPLSVQVLSMACYGLGRMCVFGMFFSNIGKRFGYRYYGTMAGVGLIVSALVSLLQYPLIALAAGGSEGWVNLGCAAVLTVEGFPYCVWLHRRETSGCKPGK
jgi:Nitrate/nitrite transporter